MRIQKNAYVDVNPVVVTANDKIILARRKNGLVWLVWGGKWHLPGGRVQFKETLEATLKRVIFGKTT